MVYIGTVVRHDTGGYINLYRIVSTPLCKILGPRHNRPIKTYVVLAPYCAVFATPLSWKLSLRRHRPRDFSILFRKDRLLCNCMGYTLLLRSSTTTVQPDGSTVVVYSCTFRDQFETKLHFGTDSGGIKIQRSSYSCLIFDRNIIWYTRGFVISKSVWRLRVEHNVGTISISLCFFEFPSRRRVTKNK